MTPEDFAALALRAAAPAGRAWRRRLAARRLAALRTPEAAGALAKAAVSTPDTRVAAIAHRALARLSDQDGIDAVCSVWQDTLDETLGDLIRKHGWLAAKPVGLRVLTALHRERGDVLLDAGPEIATALSAAAADEPPPLCDLARAALTELRRDDARDAVCRQGIDGGNWAALDAAVVGGFVPADPAHRAVLLFLAGESDRYTELDFDGALLRSVFARAHHRTRARLAHHARASGMVEWIRVAAREPDELTDVEWGAARDLLVAGERWDELCRLAVHAPPLWAARLLREPALRSDRFGAEFAELVALADACPSEVPPGTVFDPGALIDGKSYSVALSADGHLLARAKGGVYRARDDEVEVWDLRSGERLARLTGLAGPIFRLVLSSDGRHLVLGGNDYLELRRLPSGRPVTRLQDHPRSEAFAAMTEDGRLLATSSRSTTDVLLWDVPSGRCTGTVQTPDELCSLAMTPDGALLATGHRAGAVHLWRLPSGEPAGYLYTGHASDVLGLAMTTDGGILAADHVTETVDLWRLPHGELVELPGRPPRDRLLIGLVGSASAGLFLGGRDGLRQLPSGELPKTPPPDLAWSSAAVTPDGSVLVSAEYIDYSEVGVRVWRSALHALCRTPVSRITEAEIERCLDADGHQPVERAWLDLVSALVRWHHRHDIEVDTEGESPAAHDIELDG